MNEWPDGWTDRPGERYGRGSAASDPEGARVMRQTRRAGVPPQQAGRGGGGGHDGFDGYDSGYNTGQVYAGSSRGGRGGGGRDGGHYGAARPRPNRGRRLRNGLIVLLVLILAWGVGTYFWADSKLHRDVDLSKVIDRPQAGQGTNYLIVGSDSRKGMSKAERQKLHTGGPTDGGRTDSMMILHIGANGDSLISLPRDSWVTIPSFVGSDSGKHYSSPGKNKLNAAYSMDGPTLLVRTVEYNTGLHIDHYAEIGFGGFAKIVDAVGGVQMTFDHHVVDKNSGADFTKGTHTLNGAQALAFVRNRHEAGSDLVREQNQQKFLSALANQTATPSTVLNPFKLYPVMSAGLDTLTVDKNMHLWDLIRMFWAMKGITNGGGTHINMPLAGNGPNTSLVWDTSQVKTLMNELNNDQKVTVKGGR
jgi:LCP family protein required for cell wall assembly